MQCFWKDGAACFLPEGRDESKALAVLVRSLMAGLNENSDMKRMASGDGVGRPVVLPPRFGDEQAT